MAVKAKASFSINRKSLLDSLSLCGGFVGTSSHFRNLRFRAGADLTLSACSGEGWAERKLPLLSPGEIDAAIDADRILRIVRGVAGADVEFAADGTGVRVSSAGATYKVPATGDVADIPEMPVIDSDPALVLTCSELARIVSLTANHASTERHDGNRQGLYFRGSNGRLAFFATNTHRLSAVTKESDFEISASVPMAALRGILKSLQIADESEVSIRFENSRMLFEWPQTKIVLQCYVGDAPDWERFVPESVASWSFDRDELISAVDRMMLIEPDFKKLLIDAKDGTCQLSSQSVSAGTAQESVPCVIDGECEPIRMNGSYLRDALVACGGEVVKLHLAGPMKAIVFSGDAEDWRGMIVPVTA